MIRFLTLCILLTVLLLSSCQRRMLYRAYPDYGRFFDHVYQYWERQPNGTYYINEPPIDSSDWRAFEDERPELVKLWISMNARDCVYGMSPKEVETLFGKPTLVGRRYNIVKEVEMVGYEYRFSCTPNNRLPLEETQLKNNSGDIHITFYGDQQIYNVRPSISWKPYKCD